MYINLYPHKQLRSTKVFFTKLGLFFIGGGSFALFNEVWLREEVRFEWTMAAAALIIAGSVCLCTGLDKIKLNDAYFSMNPEQMRYRLSVFGSEQCVRWDEVASVQIARHRVAFCMKNGKLLSMRTGAIQSAEVAHHIQASIRLAAMEKRITVNGVPMGQFAVSSPS
ncbi:hypothetical protein [Pontibacter beigongshangensis]|uniref:hypothetical protein n=1 Tax=Pontibacter beigongshangensis TaxID=2574733 RepID=UPI00164F1539|nr:hypothetical protein [Pontibacter beigongshangensis]